jgi:hypothetical protein
MQPVGTDPGSVGMEPALKPSIPMDAHTAAGPRQRLRMSLPYIAVFVAGAAIGGLGGDVPALPLTLGLVAAGGGLLLHGTRPRAGEGIDELGRRELIRARRVERPVTVASVALPGSRPRGEIRSVAADIASGVRESDLVGYAGGSRLLVVFTETSAPEALDAWSRLRAGIDPLLVDQLRVGFSSFPDDNPTWEGLRTLAFERERPAAAANDHSGASALHGAAIASEA